MKTKSPLLTALCVLTATTAGAQTGNAPAHLPLSFARQESVHPQRERPRCEDLLRGGWPYHSPCEGETRPWRQHHPSAQRYGPDARHRLHDGGVRQSPFIPCQSHILRLAQGLLLPSFTHTFV